jgi:hypothetical protein
VEAHRCADLWAGRDVQLGELVDLWVALKERWDRRKGRSGVEQRLTRRMLEDRAVCDCLSILSASSLSRGTVAHAQNNLNEFTICFF